MTILDSTTIQLGSHTVKVDDTGDWDTYARTVDECLKDADVCMITYCDRRSFASIKNWYPPRLGREIPTILVAINEEGTRNVDETEVLRLTEERGWMHWPEDILGNPFWAAILIVYRNTRYCTNRVRTHHLRILISFLIA